MLKCILVACGLLTTAVTADLSAQWVRSSGFSLCTPGNVRTLAFWSECTSAAFWYTDCKYEVSEPSGKLAHSERTWPKVCAWSPLLPPPPPAAVLTLTYSSVPMPSGRLVKAPKCGDDQWGDALTQSHQLWYV